MGANAQTAVPTFTASQVLTAAQMNESARTGVPVFATTVTRDAAFGGTGEKTLAEGQLCYVEGTGLQFYNANGIWVTRIPVSAFNTTGSSVTGTTYADFATSVAVTLNTGTSVMVFVSALMSNSSAPDACFTSFRISGATTVSATDGRAATRTGAANANTTITKVFPVTGLTAGSNTFTMQRRVSAGTGYFQDPTILVLPM